VSWIQILYLIPLTLLVCLWFWRLRGHARRGGMFDWARRRTAVLEIGRDLDGTRKLVFDGLHQHLGTMSSKRSTRKRKFNVVSHLADYGAGSHGYEFELEPLDGGRTRLFVRAAPADAAHPGDDAPPGTDVTDAVVKQLDSFAAWLAANGDGRVLHTSWGKGASQSEA
jgi:hypothetical protein